MFAADRTKTPHNNSGGTAINTPTLLSHNNYPILKIYNLDDNILVDAKFYNKNGVLVFWMSRSMYWSHINAEISQPKIDYLEIKNSNESVYLKIQKALNGDALEVEMATYLAGKLIRFEPDAAMLPNNNSIRGGQFVNCSGFINYSTR